jgi:SAM-dependent methyltransferase
MTLTSALTNIFAAPDPELNPTHVDEMVADIPLRMRNRPFDLISDWFCKFGINLEEEVRSASPHRKQVSILDHCCGVGLAAEGLARSATTNGLPNIKVTGVDLKTEPDKVRALCEIRDLLSELVDGDVTNMPFTNDSFDLVYSMAGIAYIDDGLAALKETHRVLKHSGRAFFYLMKGGLDISSNVPLDELCSSIGGAEFFAHPFLAEWKRYWTAHPEQSPFYSDGLILEMRKTGASFASPYSLWSTAPLFDRPKRSFERHTCSGIYLKN